MEDRSEGQVPFDERAALDELDRVHQEIERCRVAREAASERFEAFIRSFQEPAAAAPVETVRTPPAAPRAPETTAPPPATPAPPVRAATPPLTTPSAPIDVPSPSSAEPSLPPAAAGKRRARTRMRVASLLLLPALGALGVWAWRQQAPRGDGTSRPPEISSPAPADSPESAATPVDTAPVAAGEPAPAAAATKLEIEITTIRGVWVRVLSDGERVLERELPADARVPVAAKQTIVIRTGDAGAVRVSVGGRKPEPLGREGQVLTRTFTLAAGEIR